MLFFLKNSSNPLPVSLTGGVLSLLNQNFIHIYSKWTQAFISSQSCLIQRTETRTASNVIHFKEFLWSAPCFAYPGELQNILGSTLSNVVLTPQECSQFHLNYSHKQGFQFYLLPIENISILEFSMVSTLCINPWPDRLSIFIALYS